MTRILADKTGSAVTVAIELGAPISAYVVSADDNLVVGRAGFIDPPGAETERIFFHTEVDPEFGGRGLARMLVDAALEDSIRDHVRVVAVCPLFARHLDQHGAEFVAAGGSFRSPERDDMILVRQAVRERS